MLDMFSRTKLVLGEADFKKIQGKNIIIFGIGGVGSFCAEALIRAGIEKLTIVDNDVVSTTNLNRQLIALQSSVGRLKVEVFKERALDINPNAQITTYPIFYTKETFEAIDLKKYDYVVDCIDTITSKIYLAEFCYQHQIRIISSMGTGNRLNPQKLKITDLFKTANDPVAKVMRKELKKRNIKTFKVICSDEIPVDIKNNITKEVKLDTSKRQIIGSISFVPSVAGLIMASEVINDLKK